MQVSLISIAGIKDDVQHGPDFFLQHFPIDSNSFRYSIHRNPPTVMIMDRTISQLSRQLVDWTPKAWIDRRTSVMYVYMDMCWIALYPLWLFVRCLSREEDARTFLPRLTNGFICTLPTHKAYIEAVERG